MEDSYGRRWKTLIFENRHHSLTMYIWFALNENGKQAMILWAITEIDLNPGLLLARQKLPYSEKTGANILCVNINCELANKTTQQLYKVCLLNTCYVVCTVEHITASDSRHDIDIHLCTQTSWAQVESHRKQFSSLCTAQFAPVLSRLHACTAAELVFLELGK